MKQASLEDRLYTVVLRYHGKLLDTRRPISLYSLKTDAQIEATIHLSTISRSIAAKGPNLGKALKIKFRNNMGEEDTLETFMKEPFSALIEKYRALKNLGQRKNITLSFDGESLGLNDTPEMQDMEDEDLVDAKIK